jgi:hypothetical protein
MSVPSAADVPSAAEIPFEGSDVPIQGAADVHFEGAADVHFEGAADVPFEGADVPFKKSKSERMPLLFPDLEKCKLYFEALLNDKEQQELYFKDTELLTPSFQDLLTFLMKEAMKFNEYFNTPLYVAIVDEDIELTQRSALCILAHAFLNTLPIAENLDGQRLTFQNWMGDEPEKLKCLRNYFEVCKQRVEADSGWIGSKISFRLSSIRGFTKKEDWFAVSVCKQVY